MLYNQNTSIIAISAVIVLYIRRLKCSDLNCNNIYGMPYRLKMPQNLTQFLTLIIYRPISIFRKINSVCYNDTAIV